MGEVFVHLQGFKWWTLHFSALRDPSNGCHINKPRGRLALVAILAQREGSKSWVPYLCTLRDPGIIASLVGSSRWAFYPVEEFYVLGAELACHTDTSYFTHNWETHERAGASTFPYRSKWPTTALPTQHTDQVEWTEACFSHKPQL